MKKQTRNCKLFTKYKEEVPVLWAFNISSMKPCSKQIKRVKLNLRWAQPSQSLTVLIFQQRQMKEQKLLHNIDHSITVNCKQNHLLRNFFSKISFIVFLSYLLIPSCNNSEFELYIRWKMHFYFNYSWNIFPTE